jgi:hypothetical protein
MHPSAEIKSVAAGREKGTRKYTYSMLAERFHVRFTQCLIAYCVLFGWKLAYKGLTGEHCVNVFASQAFTILLLTLFQFYFPPAHLNPVGAWVEFFSGARSLSSALSSTLSSFAAAAAIMQLFLATAADSQLASVAVPHASIRIDDVFLHVVFAEAFLSLACVLFASQLFKRVPALASVPSFVVTNIYLLLQLQTPLMSSLGNVNPASAFASVFIHQQPVVVIVQITGNMLSVAMAAYVNELISSRALALKKKKD